MRPLSQLRSCVLTGLILAGLAGCSKQGESAKPTLDGRWTGCEVKQPDAKCTLAVNQNQVEYRGVQPGDWLRGSFVLTEQAHPKQMDLSIEEAGTMNRNDLGTTARLIYEPGAMNCGWLFRVWSGPPASRPSWESAYFPSNVTEDYRR